MSMRFATLSLLMLFVISSCRSDPWVRYEPSLYVALKTPSPETQTAHAELLKEIVAYREQIGAPPPPGVCAECALYLARLGSNDEARTYLEKELQYYPESAVFVAVVGRLLGGEEKLFDAN